MENENPSILPFTAEPDSANIKQMALTIPFPETFIYSNVSALSISFMDVRIGFGEAMPDETVVPRVGVVMPVEHAAVLAIQLMQQLHVFERNFGEIRHPAWRDLRARSLASFGALFKGDVPETATPASPNPGSDT